MHNNVVYLYFLLLLHSFNGVFYSVKLLVSCVSCHVLVTVVYSMWVVLRAFSGFSIALHSQHILLLLVSCGLELGIVTRYQ